MKFLQSLLSLVKNAKGVVFDDNKKQVNFDPWLDININEDKIRNLVKVRVVYVANVNPHHPDLDELLEEFIKTEEQKKEMKRIWYEESMLLLESKK